MSTAVAAILSCLLILLVSPASAADSNNNPADQLVAMVNSNRTAHKSPALFDNLGLGCIALQYIKAYQGHCDQVGDGMKPPNSSFAETFAPNCGVQVPTLAPITGRLLGCQSNYVSPDQAFSDILIENARGLDILYSKNHTEVGAAVSGSDSGSYFWCVLFSNGTSNSSFVLDGGVAKNVRPGCFSGDNDDCSDAGGSGSSLWPVVTGIFVVVAYVCGL